MKVGTKSVLIGAHFFLTHWLFVARGWFHLYGFSRVKVGELTVKEIEGDLLFPATYKKTVFASLLSWRLWVVFILHDLGYWGKPNMDGDEGEAHPEWACKKLNQWLGAPWGEFALLHSRFYAKKQGKPVSALCYADKLAIAYEPAWFYLPRVRWTGEIEEYRSMAAANSGGEVKKSESELEWFHGVQAYVTKWVNEHKDGRDDTWTSADRATDSSGVYQ